MLFWRIMSVLCALILDSTAFNIDSSEEHNGYLILITSSTGLQFSKENLPEGRKIIYDCELGLQNEGTIYLFDAVHPGDMKSLVIQNCYEIKLALNQRSARFDGNSMEIKINNVTSVRISQNYKLDFCSDVFTLSVSNVPVLDIDPDVQLLGRKNFFYLQNLSINTLYKNSYYESDCNKLLNMHLKNVKIKQVPEKGVCYHRLNVTFIAENSHFEHVHGNAFKFVGPTVKIINSTFILLDEAAFTINTSETFLFSDYTCLYLNPAVTNGNDSVVCLTPSDCNTRVVITWSKQNRLTVIRIFALGITPDLSGNFVKSMQNPFYIESPEVSITDNVFHWTTKPWLSEITAHDIQRFGTMSIKGNVINNWPYNFFHLKSQNLPDIIIFENNSFNCTCRNTHKFAYQTDDFILKVFLNENRKNQCSNFGNCPLYKVLRNPADICSGTFQCPEDDQTDQDIQMCASHMKSILSVLQNIDIKLEQLVSTYNSSLVNKPN